MEFRVQSSAHRGPAIVLADTAMSDTVIRVENLGKRYKIGKREGYLTLRDTLASAFKSPLRWSRKRNSSPAMSHQPSATSLEPSANNYIWALKDVTFEVTQGEVVGIIGRNGAGKTTLLKILSRITEPTEGYAEIKGRIGSLLEVGTGFHPELTGRENIYLNGAILGMKKREIDKKFDEIVAFAEIEKFIDTPVKYYSSGMYVRLAFAVAAHLEPEILLVDEVLAVGDAAFQKKCLGKMSDVAKEGRTVLFVSHNMAAVRSLCEKAFLLNEGKVIFDGSAQEVIKHYLQSVISLESIPLDKRRDRGGDGSARITSLQIRSSTHDQVISSTSGLQITITYQSNKPLSYPRFLIGIYDYSNIRMFLLDSDATGSLPNVLPPEGIVTCTTGPINLAPGRCFINIAFFRAGVMADYIGNAASFDVVGDNRLKLTKIPLRNEAMCVIQHKWELSGRGR